MSVTDKDTITKLLFAEDPASLLLRAAATAETWLAHGVSAPVSASLAARAILLRRMAAAANPAEDGQTIEPAIGASTDPARTMGVAMPGFMNRCEAEF